MLLLAGVPVPPLGAAWLRSQTSRCDGVPPDAAAAASAPLLMRDLTRACSPWML
jgi:hypothetical protein